MIEIRKANTSDATAIQTLLIQLGYTQSLEFIEKKIRLFESDERQFIFVADIDHKLAGFLSLTMIPQIALEGDFARIAYVCVDQQFRGKRIGQTLVAYAEQIAKSWGCNRMELHSGDHRKQAHEFYLGQNYEDAPKYFRKFL